MVNFNKMEKAMTIMPFLKVIVCVVCVRKSATSNPLSIPSFNNSVTSN